MRPAAARPLRSVLYVPCDNPRALEKAPGLDADAFILDLEDAVAPAAKPDARNRALTALGRDASGRPRVLRVNGLATPWGEDDLRAAAGAGGLDAVLLPKVESADTVHRAEAILRAAGAPAGLALWAMVETPRAFLRLEAIAGASPALACLVLGTADLAAELRATPGPDRAALQVPLALALLAGRAFGLAVLDGVHLDLDDDAGFAAACAQGAAMGFDGKTLIHPRTIAAANAAFAPDTAAVERARRIIAAHGEAGGGLVVVDGRLVEALHVAEAERLLARADMIALRRADKSV